jgi:hypothetical protein
MWKTDANTFPRKYVVPLCRDFIQGKCLRENCKFRHDEQIEAVAQQYNRRPKNKDKYNNRKNNQNTSINKDNKTEGRRQRNTECFEPMTRPSDMRIVCDMGNNKLQTPLTSRDILLVPNLFTTFSNGAIHKSLMNEIENCGVPQEDLLKLWHGNNVIEGTHLIANDRTLWKHNCPTFTFVVNKIKDFFDMDVQATRLNIYKDTSQWKPFHHDSAYLNPEKAKVQNFTVAVSFGCCRVAAFEHSRTKTVISIPQGDGMVYCFGNDTNAIWRHGILQDIPVREEERISIICWGKIENILPV